jgi:hypothetical protein
MQNVSDSSFGPLIAYLIPGTTALWGLSRFSPSLQALFAIVPAGAPTIGGFLYLTLAAMAVGMTVTAIRWVVIDQLHRVTGLPPPHLDFSKLPGKVESLALLIEIHYRHYQFYANMAVALVIAYGCYRMSLETIYEAGWPDSAFLFLQGVFLAMSRDTLRKYYRRSEQLLA